MRFAKTAVRLTVLAAALSLLLGGILSGGFRDVLIRAAMICLECIGIG